MKTKTILLFLWLITGNLSAQRGFYIPRQLHSVDIPFDFENNFIILHFIVDGKLPLSFILDTGAGHSLITRQEVALVLGHRYEREFQVYGADLSKPLLAYLIRNVKLEVPDKLTASAEDMLVLDQDVFQFEQYVGIPIHGVLSANIFARYLFKINYDRQVITLYEREFFDSKKLKGYQSFPIEVRRDKPYITLPVQLSNDVTIPTKLLLDTGASLALMLFEQTHPAILPPSNAIRSSVGAGLGGDIEAVIGRIPTIYWGEWQQQEVISFFQQTDSLEDREISNYRNGLIGNELLSRYHLIFDYYAEQLWVKPARKYKHKFVFDRSGITVIATGTTSRTFLVQYVLPDSPAALAGVQRGDRVLRVNRNNVLFMSLSGIHRKLQGKPGKKVTLRLERNGEKITTSFVLKDML